MGIRGGLDGNGSRGRGGFEESSRKARGEEGSKGRVREAFEGGSMGMVGGEGIQGGLDREGSRGTRGEFEEPSKRVGAREESRSIIGTHAVSINKRVYVTMVSLSATLIRHSWMRQEPILK